MTFGGLRIDAAVVRELIHAVEPMAIEEALQECESRLDAARAPKVTPAKPDFARLAEDLDAAWKTPHVTMRTRQQLLRALVNDGRH